MICVDPRNPRAGALHQALASRLDLSTLPDDLGLVMGGDGWMLRCVRDHGTDVTWLGLNAGNLGFLLSDVPDFDAAARALRDGRWTTWSFPRLHMTAWHTDGTVSHAEAVNDVYVERSTGHTAHLRLHIEGVEVVNRMSCDGVIVATALGSTAYSFSAGGPACHPRVRAVHVTPICPHTPRLSPITLPEGTPIEIEALDADRRPVRASSDGVDHGRILRLQVERADPDVRLAFLDGHQLTGTLIRKILRA